MFLAFLEFLQHFLMAIVNRIAFTESASNQSLARLFGGGVIGECHQDVSRRAEHTEGMRESGLRCLIHVHLRTHALAVLLSSGASSTRHICLPQQQRGGKSPPASPLPTTTRISAPQSGSGQR